MSKQPRTSAPIPASEVAELIRIAQQHGISELTVQQGGDRVEIRLASPPRSDVSMGPAPALRLEPAADAVEILSPMTGVFYSAPSPAEPPFLHPGDHVHEGDPIGLIEAMKVFSEVLADRSGRVRRVLVGNGQLVQQGQPLVELYSAEPAAL